jgi:glycerophosphoryl diester phosphodiesterase
LVFQFLSIRKDKWGRNVWLTLQQRIDTGAHTIPRVRKPLLLGHRGARAHTAIPENTIPSFDLALKHGCDGFEFDVRRSRDGEAVVCHDAEVSGAQIAECKGDELGLPRLRDVLARYATDAFLDIELKVAELESELLIALDRYPPQCGYVVTSFFPDVLKEMRVRDAKIPLGLLCDRREHLEGWRELSVEYVAPHYSLVTAALVEQVHSDDKLLLTWTVNDRSTMLRFAEWQVDGIISDETEMMVRAFAPTAG